MGAREEAAGEGREAHTRSRSTGPNSARTRLKKEAALTPSRIAFPPVYS